MSAAKDATFQALPKNCPSCGLTGIKGLKGCRGDPPFFTLLMLPAALLYIVSCTLNAHCLMPGIVVHQSIGRQWYVFCSCLLLAPQVVVADLAILTPTTAVALRWHLIAEDSRV